MKKSIILLCGSIVFSLLVMPVWAGLDVNATVVLAGNSASGAMGDTKASANNVEYIGCWSNSANQGGCVARNAAGVSLSCVTNMPPMLGVIRALSDNTYIRFSTNNAGQCTFIQEYTNSLFLEI